MSSPSRQVSNRRLPPLPMGPKLVPLSYNSNSSNGRQTTNTVSTGNSTAVTTSPTSVINNVTGNGSSTLTTELRTAVVGKSYEKYHNGVVNKSSTSPSYYHYHPNDPGITTATTTNNSSNLLTATEVDSEGVAQYLKMNPDVLDDFVATNISQGQLEKWLMTKTRRQRAMSDTESIASDGGRNTVIGSKWKFSNHSDKRKLLQEWMLEINNKPNQTLILSELINCLSSVIQVDGKLLYVIDTSTEEMYLFAKHDPSCITSGRQAIGMGTTIPAYVATCKESIRLDDILIVDERFPDGIGIEENTAQSIICQPVIKSNGEIIAVILVYRTVNNSQFNKEDEETISSFLLWAGAALYYAGMYHSMEKERKLNEFLLTMTKSIFQDIVSMDTVITKIMNYAQKLVDADRASLFLVDNKSNELYARIFDVGNNDNDDKVDKNIKEIRFPMSKGIAGYVATSGNVLNIKDAYKDSRFNREIDSQTGYTTKTILCMPIFIRGKLLSLIGNIFHAYVSVIGVVQMVNKRSSVFTQQDEQSFETFAVYCGLALHHAKIAYQLQLYDKIRRSEQKYKVALEVLSYHSQCSHDELHSLRNADPVYVASLARYDFDVKRITDKDIPGYVLFMFRDIFAQFSKKNESEDKYDIEELMKFTLTVRKNYRKVPYHNWYHAFTVAHTMYTIIKKNPNLFTELEAIGLYVACLCHDLDHRGRNNAFMVNSSTPLAAVYSTSTMEHHHFNQTITILQNDGHNIFSHLNSEEYKTVLGYIKHAILATDLALFFGNKSKLKAIVDAGEFSWNNSIHRALIRAIAVTACDISSNAKPWDINKDTVKVIFQEFYAQGDEEKRQGRQPIPMMDRGLAHELPANQVGFVVGICLPCYELLVKVLPGTQPMLDGIRANLKKWSLLVAKQKAVKEKAEATGKKYPQDCYDTDNVFDAILNEDVDDNTIMQNHVQLNNETTSKTDENEGSD
ncbi:putative 3',5'-cyclic phosphodiesterase pde-5 [Trichoplax sp. H2]|nr:putative 3',5'-cyclic phosphodiesterase pde-5 [Trichoplax sp. H2]|eukprot:RDD45317.1 putative 3',5'-cyclic phosphodiesterase pde-5 [Trichoplax sp. H2]